jgi:hypothetical protein
VAVPTGSGFGSVDAGAAAASGGAAGAGSSARARIVQPPAITAASAITPSHLVMLCVIFILRFSCSPGLVITDSWR